MRHDKSENRGGEGKERVDAYHFGCISSHLVMDWTGGIHLVHPFCHCPVIITIASLVTKGPEDNTGMILIPIGKGLRA